MKLLGFLFGDENQKKIKTLEPLVQKINVLETQAVALSPDELKGKTAEFKLRISKDADLEEILPEAFAVVREAAKRTLGERHFDVQLLGGIVMHRGGIAEMRTGEGKTLVATLPVYLNALSGKGVHVVTVNDYLSRRDSVWMGQIYDALGLRVGCITSDGSYIYDSEHRQNPESRIPNPKQIPNPNNKNSKEDNLDATRDTLGSFKVVHEFLRPVSRREAYEADITYGTNNEFGFDYLRDNLEYEPEKLRQREHRFAVVDEIDSILIDEARTPLIISAPSAESESLYKTFASIVASLKAEEDYTIDEKFRSIALTESGIEKVEKKLGVDNLYAEGGVKLVHHLETAIKAKALYKRDKEYVVKDNQIIIVDEFTGRLMAGRHWSEGLHQAVEAKEGVPIQKESRTFASITFQNYFRLYAKLSGMTGTAATSKEEFFKVYRLDVVSIPTNKPMARLDQNDLIFQSERGKFKAVAKKVKELNGKGQPVLVGTVSIEKNEVLSAYLSAVGIPHEVLNAKNHEREGEIIAQAGRRGAVTIATNMAGRGVDIKLGGNPAKREEYEAVKNSGGLFVIGTERHEARRIDNQLRGRSGRQGDAGETQFFVSLEDSLMRIFAKDMLKKAMGRIGMAEDEPIESRLITKALETAQTKIEGFNFDARKHVLEYDDVLNHQRKIVYERRRALVVGKEAVTKDYLGELASNHSAFGAVLSEKIKAVGENLFYQLARRVLLQTIDMFWVEQLEAMDHLRGSVNLRAYGQRDPLVEYKREGLMLFKEMQNSIGAQIMGIISNLATKESAKEMKPLEAIARDARVIGGSSNSADVSTVSTPKKTEVGRNDPCWCGSGKKYKKCHGR